jgi:hypothetical protein
MIRVNCGSHVNDIHNRTLKAYLTGIERFGCTEADGINIKL